jgi:hypothetical protein
MAYLSLRPDTGKAVRISYLPVPALGGRLRCEGQSKRSPQTAQRRNGEVLGSHVMSENVL